MMRIRPIRRLLTIQYILIAACPFLCATVLCLILLYHQIRSNISLNQSQLAQAVANQVTSYLTAAQTSIRFVASITENDFQTGNRLQQILETQVRTAPALQTVYAVSRDGKILGAGLAPGSPIKLHDLSGVDLSRNPLFQEARRDDKPIWSDTFLSVMGGGLVAALAVPAPRIITIGEINVTRLSHFLKTISLEKQQVLLLIDRRGQVIADADGQYTAQQLNVKNIPLVRKGLESTTPVSGSFVFQGKTVIAQMLHIPAMNWHILAAIPAEKAFQPLYTIFKIITAGFLLTLAGSIIASMLFSRRLARRFESIAIHARNMIEGKADTIWPQSNISEFNQLSDNLNKMAGTLRKQEREMTTLMSNLPGMVYRCDPDPPRTIRFVSSGCMSLTGHTFDDASGKTISDISSIIHPEDQGWVRLKIEQHLARKKTYQLIYRIITRNSQTRWITDHGQGVVTQNGDFQSIEGFMTDITARKLADDRARQSEKRYRDLFEESKDMVFISTPEGRYLNINTSGVKMLGYRTKEEVYALNIAQDLYKNSEDRRKLLLKLKVVGFVKDYEVQLKRRDGRMINVLITATALHDQNKEIASLRGIMRDVTDRKKLENQLRQAQKMEAIGVLAGGIAHDFNNILVPIMGYTELLQEQIDPKSSNAGFLQRIIEAANRAKALVNQILTFSRQKEHEQYPIQVQYIAKEVLELVRATLPANIEIRRKLSACGLIQADPSQIHQVIMNLCTNAYHAMRKAGGTLEITLRQVEIDEDRPVDGPDLQLGPYALLEIRDSGPGMEATVLSRIFEPYFTTKKEGEGTGLGLSVVHGIVQNHKGHIQVESKPGEGTCFSLYFPIIAENRKQAPLEPLLKIPGGSERILVVDDEKTIVDLEVHMLEGLGYKVTGISSSVEALHHFENSPDAFDLVITDMTMPNMDGAELCRRILQIRETVPIVLCTGFSDILSEAQARAIGIRRYVMKPVIKKEIAQIIRDLLEEAAQSGPPNR